LGLTVFVRHLVDLVKQFPIVFPQGKKELGDRDLKGFLSFFPLLQQQQQQKTMPSNVPSFFIENMYVSQDI
jgi:hypothetical protein